MPAFLKDQLLNVEFLVDACGSRHAPPLACLVSGEKANRSYSFSRVWSVSPAHYGGSAFISGFRKFSSDVLWHGCVCVCALWSLLSSLYFWVFSIHRIWKFGASISLNIFSVPPFLASSSGTPMIHVLD